MSLPKWPALSRQLSRLLDKCGYGRHDVYRRVLTQTKHSDALRWASSAFVTAKYILRIIGGSRGEGVALQGERDEDVIYENTRMAAICDDYKGDLGEKTRYVFQQDRRCMPAGYTRLRLIPNEKWCLNGVENKLVRIGKHRYFSSAKCMEQFMNDMTRKSLPTLGHHVHYHVMTGPSLPKTIEFQCHEKMDEIFPSLATFLMLWNDKKDAVRAIPCYCPDMLSEWQRRPRLFDWPTENTIEEAAKARCHVVPVGMKNCPGSDLQWRFSFSFVEKHLVESFNDTQTKLFVVLRHIARIFLDDAITSYMIKNVLFWEYEKTSTKYYTEDQLLDRLEEVLVALREYIQQRHLPNYIIPERNLLHHKLGGGKREMLLEQIEYLLKHGIVMLHDYIDCKTQEERYPKVTKLMKEKEHLRFRDEVFRNLLEMYSSQEFGEILYKHYRCETVEMFYALNISLFILPYLKTYGPDSLRKPQV